MKAAIGVVAMQKINNDDEFNDDDDVEEPDDYGRTIEFLEEIDEDGSGEIEFAEFCQFKHSWPRR